jgi:3'-phosphoadenosine 5'-phosphosulfate sulfotransferase (PAPS reductase)/FAD synthetase
MMRKIYDRLSVAVGLPWFVTYSGGKDSAVVLDIAYRFSREVAAYLRSRRQPWSGEDYSFLL